jgi:hypothetical protein
MNLTCQRLTFDEGTSMLDSEGIEEGADATWAVEGGICWVGGQFPTHSALHREIFRCSAEDEGRFEGGSKGRYLCGGIVG